MQNFSSADVFPPNAVHVFCELTSDTRVACGLCQEQEAAFYWTKQCDYRVPEDHLVVCRVCASMILLVGKHSGMSRNVLEQGAGTS